MLDKRTIDISTGIIFRTILILFGIWIVYIVRDVIAILFVSLIITAAIEPAVKKLIAIKIPRSFSVLIIFLVMFFIVGVLVSFLIPPIVSQFNNFIADFPERLDKFTKSFTGIENYFLSHGIVFSSQEFFQSLSDNLSQSSGRIFSTTVSIFHGFISLIAILSLTFYLSVKEEGMKNFIFSVVPEAHAAYAASLAERIRERIGMWLQGQIVLMLIIFVLDYVALYLLGVPYALILAVLAGVLEIIPYLGPLISAIPGVILGFLISPLTGLLVLAAYIIIQQFENHIIVPQVMKKAIGLNPVTVILALLVGAKLGGVFGAILAIPMAAAASVFIKDLLERKEAQKNNLPAT